jgi:hypothetical protein
VIQKKHTKALGFNSKDPLDRLESAFEIQEDCSENDEVGQLGGGGFSQMAEV